MNVKLLLRAVIGAILLLAGAVLLVLPGPGLLLVLAGLVLLSGVFPRLERYVGPVRVRAMKAAEDSVSSPWRLAGSLLAVWALIGVGIALGLVPALPFSGWYAGGSIILSGLILLGTLIYSYSRSRVRANRDSRR